MSTRKPSRSTRKTATPDTWKATAPTPSVEEYLGITIDRREAYTHGQFWALIDEVKDAFWRANRLVGDLPRISITAPKSIVWFLGDDDPVSLPKWAVEALCRIVAIDGFVPSIDGPGGSMETTGGVGRHAQRDQQYDAALKDWHRYVLITREIERHGNPWEGNAKGTLTAYQLVSRQLAGTSFAASPGGMRKAFERVSQALELHQYYRYYRSRAHQRYEELIDPGGNHWHPMGLNTVARLLPGEINVADFMLPGEEGKIK